MFFVFWTPRLKSAATAEVPLTGIYSNRLLSKSQLSIKMVGFGRAFAPKQELKGLIRKDYTKFISLASRIVCFDNTAREQSIYEEIRLIQEELGLFYR